MPIEQLYSREYRAIFPSMVLRLVLAEEISRPRTRAASVAMRPVASLITSVEFWLRWCAGRIDRSAIPRMAPEKRLAKTITVRRSEFMAKDRPTGLATSMIRERAE
jgi:hypothetical protein